MSSLFRGRDSRSNTVAELFRPFRLSEYVSLNFPPLIWVTLIFRLVYIPMYTELKLTSNTWSHMPFCDPRKTLRKIYYNAASMDRSEMHIGCRWGKRE